MDIQTIGIIGAGKLGTALAQLALKSGYKVYVSGSGNPEKIALTVSALMPGATATTNAKVADNSDVIILALPLAKFRAIPASLFAGKLVIDAMNHWWEVDGPREDIVPSSLSSSEAVQQYFSSSHIVKAFSHMGYHHLHDGPTTADDTNRKAIAVAGNSESDVETVCTIIERFGFDPFPIGQLAEGRRLEPGYPAFGANVDKKALQQITQNTQLSS